MELSYRKNDNQQLFTDLGTLEKLKLTDIQNYVPIYDKFFALNENNHNSINLNHHYSLHRIEECITSNHYTGTVKDNEGKSNKCKIFFKYSPLLDPIKYLVGKLDISNSSLFNLPGYNKKNIDPKILDPNNTAYVDAFATYLTSQLLHKHGFVHGLDFYGSFLSIKEDFEVNLNDDIEYLYESSFFHKNQGLLFTLDSDFQEELMNFDSRKMKKPLHMDSKTLSPTCLTLADIDDLSELDTVFQKSDDSSEGKNPELMFEATDMPKNGSRSSVVREGSSSSSCSSRTSYTNENDSCDSSSSHSGDSECSTATEDAIMATIPRFPIQAIALEKCEQTLDSLLVQDKLSDRELSSMVMQVAVTLMTLQKTLGLTHNDLHTNNIMCTLTNEKFLFYKINKMYYKVPTYGRIYKLIDFGRAIYKFKGVSVCSDSFHAKGDAATQYNFEPYFNENKPRLEPNFSFDLCRLGCSMYDFLVEDITDEMKDLSEIEQIIVKWCHDDKGRNIMYKMNGMERYPEFKLYKMIARTVHNHTPQSVVADKHFSKFIVNKKQAHKGSSGKIMDIDSYPVYCD